ncbi:modular serine protease [Anabrus simplex]|uniref:modular serine protease n=1 Tax=Anabrus simplex TaxID=316456 RepID=UPI0035A3672C
MSMFKQIPTIMPSRCPETAFQCQYGACIKKHHKCDGNHDCADGSDENHCGHEEKSCNVTEFRCDSGECIEQRRLCDGQLDCADSSDETAVVCSDILCPSNSFQCRYGACVSKLAMCNGKRDCRDNSDETNILCPKAKCENKTSCQKKQQCSLEEHQCQSGDCISRHLLCDGHSHCSDGSDESTAECSNNECPPAMFRCHYGGCIARNLTCTETAECVDWSDEDPELCGKPHPSTSCRLPALTPHARYEATRCINCKPGAVVAEYEELTFTCDVGHKLQGVDTVYCHKGAWVPRLPTCSPAKDDVTCSPITSKRIIATCESLYGNHRGWVPCDNPVPVGTVARYQCRQYYEPNEEHMDNTESICTRDGTWSQPILECKPECGRAGQEVTPLVVNGQEAQYGIWPWQTGLYVLQAGNWSFWCGGSLVNEYAVVTAAHCVWKVTPESLKVAFGKFYRDFEKVQELTQIRNIKEIIMQPAYQDQGGNYGSDLAVLALSSPVEFTTVVRPICIDWKLEHMNTDIVENNTGVVVGWGVNENDTFSDTLRMTRLQIAGDERCIQEQPRDFKKYVTYTTFCAGFRNGTGVCNGDSGGGLVFQAPDKTWNLQGVVSVSPRRRGTSFCDPTYYTVFTKVGIYVKWLDSTLNSIMTRQQQDQKLDDDLMPSTRFSLY